MTDRKQQIGIDRLIRYDWLEYTVNLVLSENSEENIKNNLEEKLKVDLGSYSSSIRGTISKTQTVLLKTWLRVPEELNSLRNEGLKLFESANKPERLMLHWGMIMAAYPFWGSVAGQTGRLLQLQDNVSAKQVQRRLIEQYGERETVSRRVRYVLRAFIDWGVLKDTNNKGTYCQGEKILIENLNLVAWLIEATLYSRASGSGTMKELIFNPNLFPFQLVSISPNNLVSNSPRLNVVKHGLDEDLVMLKK